jgi:uncharacterized protein YndB with AHSA1/START domain
MIKKYFSKYITTVGVTILSLSFISTNGQSSTNMESSLIIKKERQINSDTKKIWNVLTDPKYIEQWLGVKAESEWTPNSEIVFSFTWEGKNYIDKGLITQFDKEKTFSYKYWSVFSGLPDIIENYSNIEFQLVPTKNGVTLKLTHNDFATETMYKHSDKNWEETLNEIEKLSED